MNQPNVPPGNDPQNPTPPGGPPPLSGPSQQPPTGARVPEHVSQGVFASGVVVLDGPGEFIIDFIQSVIRPARVVKRIVLNPAVMGQFLDAFRDNLGMYEKSFGLPKPMPRPANPDAPKPSIQDLYDELKVPDTELGGVYANAVLITHSPAEFAFDFMARFFPRPVVCARIYVSAMHVPNILESIRSSFQHRQQQIPPPRPESNPPPLNPPQP